MSWFEEQLKYRNQRDDEVFEEAIRGIAGAVMGKRLTDALSASELAQSAIEEILRFYHLKMKTDELPSKVKTVEEQMEYRMRPFGIMRRRVLLEEGWERDAVGPMLGTMKEDGRVVALIPGKFTGYTYLDIRTGERVRVSKKNEKLFDEEAVCFYKPLPLKSLSMFDLVRFAVGQLSVADIVLYIAMMAISALLGMLSPVFTRWLFGNVLESGSVRVLLALAVFMVAFSCTQALFGAYHAMINNRVNIKQNIAVQAAVMNRVMSLPADFFKKYAAGELTQRASYVNSLCSLLMNSVAGTGLTAVFSLVYVGQLFLYAPTLVVPALLTSLATLIFSVITTFMQMHITREQMELSSKESGMSYSMISGIQKIKLAGAEKRMFSRWAALYTREAALTYNPPAILKLNSAIQTAISLVGWFVMYYFAYRDGVSVADYYAFNTAYAMVSSAFLSVGSIATVIAAIKPTLEMARPIMEAEPELSDGQTVVTSIRGSIELNNVSFRYAPDMPNVIDNLSLRIKAGEYVAIVGTTGCGKSTLMRLMLGFEKPQRGAIYYDRQDISRVDLKSLRRLIGTVMQDGKLFLGDIYSNIVISAPQLTLDEAWEAAEIASVADDIRAMPMGMFTIVSEGQGGISGGQRQRLMIARAIAPKPKVLMFDEATSALDNVTQKKVSDAIDKLKCTRIVIAHRLSTIRHADRIIVLDKGQIIEEGTYESLIAENGFFAELVARQRLDTEE